MKKLVLIFLLVFLQTNLFARECQVYTNYSYNYCTPYYQPNCSTSDALCVENVMSNMRSHLGCYAPRVLIPGQVHPSCEYDNFSGYYSRATYDATCCTDQCAADSIQCPANAYWNSDECRCENDYCEDYRNECQSMGGDFSGYNDVINECCRGHCNLCGTNSSMIMMARVAKVCCDAGKAPPVVERACFGNAIQAGCGVSTSEVCQNNSCFCLDSDDPNYLFQRAQCPNYSSSSTGGSSSSGGGSSGSGSSSSGGGSSGGSSGSGDDWEYDYRDSLHKIIVNTAATTDAIGDLVFCLMSGDCKTDLTFTNSLIRESIHVDSLIYELIKDRMDSTIKVDNEQLELLRQIAQQGFPGDSVLWKKTDSAAGLIYGEIARTNDTVGAVVARLADSIGVSTDSLIKHLDSIWKSLTVGIQDSILKYQRYASDNFDSALYGKGKGFGLIDKLIDSSVKYFQGTIAALETLSVDVGLDSGLFSSDTSINPTIRNIDSALMHIIDTSLYDIWSEIAYVGDSVNTLKPYLSALGDSLGGLNGSLTGAIDGLGDSIGSLKGVAKSIGDSVSKYGRGIAAVGDSVGGVRGAVNGLGDSLSGWWNGNGKGGLDTSGNGVGGAGLDSVLNGTSLYGDSAGVAHIVRAGINDTSLHYGPGGVFDTSGIYAGGSDVDTTGDDTLYALPSIDSVKAALERSIQEDYDSAEIKYRAYFDTLKDEMQLINWDSVILAPLAQKVPNTNTCPEECFAVSSQGAPTSIGSIPFSMGSFNLNFGLCTSWSVLGGMNVMLFIRVLLRLVVALTCVYIGAWFIAGKK